MQEPSKFDCAFQEQNTKVVANINPDRADGPDSSYCILITPRSGSTWLTQTIGAYEVLSYPSEYFYTGDFALSLQHNPARNLEEYYKAVASNMMTDDRVFGFEMSYFELVELERNQPLRTIMTGMQRFIYLSRRHFIDQAVSMFMAFESRVFHKFSTTNDDRAIQAEAAVPYHKDKIRFWATHILQQEYGLEKWLEEQQVPVLRLFYEDMLSDIHLVVGRIARWVGVTLTNAQRLTMPQPIRLAGPLHASYVERMLRDEASWCEEWNYKRGRMPCEYGDQPWPYAESDLN